MKKSYEKLLAEVRSTLLASAKDGISPEEHKQVIIYLLSPYFENKNVLEELAIPLLSPEAVNIARISKDAWAINMFVNVLGDYHKAKKLDNNNCYSGIASFHPKIIHSNAEYVSLFNLNTNLNDLPLSTNRGILRNAVCDLWAAFAKNDSEELV